MENPKSNEATDQEIMIPDSVSSRPPPGLPEETEGITQSPPGRDMGAALGTTWGDNPEQLEAHGEEKSFCIQSTQAYKVYLQLDVLVGFLIKAWYSPSL